MPISELLKITSEQSSVFSLILNELFQCMFSLML